tara:strand:+ start:169 stop:1065 length:897 start_codon:yes stop_codon:yes gene_type:complete
MNNQLIALILAMRLPFLLLTCSVILLSIAAALATGVDIKLMDAVLVMSGALAAHISVNLLNEYQDFQSGLDALTSKTPFSGGSGALIARPSAAKFIAKMTVLFLGITIAIGLYFTLSVGFPLLAIGIVGVVIIVLYTQWLNKQAILCLIACGFAFGPLMVLGGYFVLTGTINATILLISLVPFFLTNNLLLINQFPDITPDKSVGRNNFPIKYGINISLYVYFVFVLLAMITTFFILLSLELAIVSYLTLLPMLIALVVVLRLKLNNTVMTNIITAMAVSVMSAVLSPLLLALAIYLT